MRRDVWSALFVLVAWIALPSALSSADWRRALPGWDYTFPRDHYAHPEFKTEWWYFTGHLKTAGGREFGYQVTFFRHGIVPPANESETTSRFVRNAFHFGHFAVSDLGKKKFHFDQRVLRGAFGESGDHANPSKTTIAWLGDWKLSRSDETFAFQASLEGAALDLKLKPMKPVTINGSDGVSQKSPGEGNATHYYSITRLASTGTLTIGGEGLKVTGESWFDREWGSNQLASDQVGWDWFSIQFEDNTELMLYRLRTTDEKTHPSSGGTFVDATGGSRTLKRVDFELEPREVWKSKTSEGRYPIEWGISIPDLDLDLKVIAAFPNQELTLPLITYWEGAVKITGTRSGSPVKGVGYLEMTGYADPLDVLK